MIARSTRRAKVPACYLHVGRSIAALAPLVVAACVINGPSKVAQGQLYMSGQPSYDEYFRNVHQYQVDAAGWGDDRKNAHRALVGNLELTPDAPDVTIVQASHESASRSAKQAGSVRLEIDGTSAKITATNASGGDALFRAVEDTAHQELERAKRLHSVSPKIDALSKQGTDLTAHAKADWAPRGTTKEEEVEGELSASLDVLSHLKSRAESEARESEDFVADLERALETASEERAAKQKDKRKKKDHGDKQDKPDRGDSAPSAAAPKAAPQPASDSPPPQKAAAAPKPAETGEVFTP